jgi:hypothetical protein
LILHERENIETLDFAIRQETVDGVLLFPSTSKTVCNCVNASNSTLRRFRRISFSTPPAFLSCVLTDHQAAQAHGIDVLDVRQVETVLQQWAGWL